MTDEELEAMIWRNVIHNTHSVITSMPYGKDYNKSFNEQRRYNKFVSKFPTAYRNLINSVRTSLNKSTYIRYD